MKWLNKLYYEILKVLRSIYECLIVILSPFRGVILSYLFSVVIASPAIVFLTKSCHRDRKEVVAPSYVNSNPYLSILEIKMDVAKRSINGTRMIEILDTISQSDFKTLVVLEDSLLLYIEKLENFLAFDFHSNTEDLADTDKTFNRYFTLGRYLTQAKVNRVNEISEVLDGISLDENSMSVSKERVSLLDDKLKDWNDNLKEKQNELKMIQKEDPFRSQEVEFENKYDSLRLRFEYNLRSIQCIVDLINLYKSNSFYECEIIYMEIVIDYNQRIKGLLRQES